MQHRIKRKRKRKKKSRSWILHEKPSQTKKERAIRHTERKKERLKSSRQESGLVYVRKTAKKRRRWYILFLWLKIVFPKKNRRGVEKRKEVKKHIDTRGIFNCFAEDSVFLPNLQRKTSRRIKFVRTKLFSLQKGNIFFGWNYNVRLFFKV